MKSHKAIFLKCGNLICICISLQFQLLASALFKSGSDFTALGKCASSLSCTNICLDFGVLCGTLGEVHSNKCMRFLIVVKRLLLRHHLPVPACNVQFICLLMQVNGSRITVR